MEDYNNNNINDQQQIIKMEDTSTITDGGGGGDGGGGVFSFSDNIIPNGLFDFCDGDKCSVGFMELLGLNYNSEFTEAFNNPPATPNCSSSVSSASSDAPNDDEPPQQQQQHNPTKQVVIIKFVNRLKGIKKKKEKEKEKKARFAFMTKSEVDHLEDGYRWRKYGQKAVKNSPFPRSYYRCTSAACNVKKRVERSFADPTVVVTTYEGQHTHPSPILTRSALAVAIPTPPFTPGPGGECVGGVVAMPWLKPTNNDAHDGDILPAMSHQYFQNSTYFTAQNLAANHNRNNHIGAANAAGILQEKRFCNPNSSFLVDHGLLQDVVPPHMLKQE
ncbi:WRKY transcription factor 68-like isoform X1 [Cucumis melo]|uniref:WRKY transcription factor 68-like isoform X1 n=2 Tax=Cucumis melo TaxID=3656 RepID=A0ABM3KR82_CUCME|nr:WRKY transcription factor 68-like isoform X1 [Cucumis melo]